VSSSDWDFPYCPVPTSAGDDDGVGGDVVVATRGRVDPTRLATALAAALGGATFEVLVERAPLYWYRVKTGQPVRRAALAQALSEAGLDLRYVASTCRGGEPLPESLVTRGVRAARARAWRVRARPAASARVSDGMWFLGADEGGVSVDRAVCGHGAGTRLAVIDDDAGEAAQLELDAEVLVNVDRARRAHSHGSAMVAWATRTRDGRFQGVAPAASPRLYLIPKPETDVVSLPLAIVRAVDDGADVVVCATYVEGSSSCMLDDALEFAARLGRRGRGAVVLFPTGREARSPRHSVHASFSLCLLDPASDLRVICVAPGGRGGGWFLWRDKNGRLRPFANRGPAVRCLAPGDDISYPFLERERLAHAESSGASAIAAGVALLVLAQNPTLTAGEVTEILCATALSPDPAHPTSEGPLADLSDVLPRGQDEDGHSAKHGYGVLHAARACAVAADPVASSLFGMGETDAALHWAAARQRTPSLGGYTPRRGRHLARVLLADGAGRHGLRALLRHARLLAHDARRREGHPAGGGIRQLALLARAAGHSPLTAEAPRAVRRELARLERALGAQLRKGQEGRAAAERRLLLVGGWALFGHLAPSAASPWVQRDDVAGRVAPM